MKMAINPESLLGYTLTIVIIGAIIWYFLLKNNAYKNPVRRDKIDLDAVVDSSDIQCPECSSEDVKLDITMAPVLMKCRACDHEWIYVPRDIR